MRTLVSLCVATLIGCGGAKPTPVTETADPVPEDLVPPERYWHGSREVPAAPAPPPSVERLTADTARTTSAGHTFVAPAEWSIRQVGSATVLEPPEGGGSFIALVDVPQAKDAEAVVAAGWAAVQKAQRKVQVVNAAPDKDGWTDAKVFVYETSPNERRTVIAAAQRGGGGWLAVVYDMAQPVAEKRGSQVQTIFGRLLPKGGERESFAGKTAATLDAARIAQLGTFIEGAQRATRVPGVALGLIQNGKVVFAGGFGVRELGKPAKVDADTKFMVASNTKALTTLMLAKLVEAGKATWETPATQLLPTFKLGDAETTKQVQVKHLICACTGMPRHDMEAIFQFAGVKAADVVGRLANIQPTSKFGALFQYSNELAAAAGYIGGHVAFPKLELGTAYDRAMQTLVFDPLGMKATTLDYARGKRGNAAVAHAVGYDGVPVVAGDDINKFAIPDRPAGAVWSSVRDMLRYVQMELDEGALPRGKRYIAKEPLLARRTPQVAIGKDVTYGMGLTTDTTHGIPVIHHGGDVVGFHSDMIWLPEHGVGAVILTNGDPGWLIRSIFKRKLLEVLFDGKPEADTLLATEAKTFLDNLAAERKQITVPADATVAGKLGARYLSDALGELVVRRTGEKIVFDVGEWKSEVGSRKNADGSISFVLVAPGFAGLELVVGTGDKPTLVLRDAQHEYVFEAK